MNDIKIMIEDNIAKVFTPYNKDFVTRIKRGIGGAKWNGSCKCWEVPANAVDVVRSILLDVYGYSDEQQNVETVKVRIKANDYLESECSDVLFCSKVLCHASGRDSGGIAGNDVFYISGRPRSGGSAKWWNSVVEIDSVIDVANVSKILLDRYLQNPDGRIEIISVTDEDVDKEALIQEREKLLHRLAEIEKMLEHAK